MPHAEPTIVTTAVEAHENSRPEGRAVLLIAHGSRRPEANADLVKLAELLAEDRPGEIIETSYLELAEPDIPTGGERCVQRGAKAVRMLPYFLSAGAHVVEDLRQHQSELSTRFPHVEFQLCPHLGLHPLMVEIVRQRLGEAGKFSAEILGQAE